MDHPMSQTALPSALMKFYTDIETTGQSTEFYDKFTIRFHISIILKGMWERPMHKQVMQRQDHPTGSSRIVAPVCEPNPRSRGNVHAFKEVRAD